MGDLLAYKTNINITYHGTVEFCTNGSGRPYLKGRIIGIRRSITYQAFSLEELQYRFEEAVNQYLAECIREKRRPEQPYKGILSVRLTPNLHRELAKYALDHDRNLNGIIVEAISDFLKRNNDDEAQKNE